MLYYNNLGNFDVSLPCLDRHSWKNRTCPESFAMDQKKKKKKKWVLVEWELVMRSHLSYRHDGQCPALGLGETSLNKNSVFGGAPG